MLVRRIAVAGVGLPLLGALVAAPEPVFGIAVTLILAAAAYELVRAAVPAAGHAPAAGAGAAAALVVAAARSVEGFRLWTLLPALAFALVLLLRRGGELRTRAPAWWLLAVLYAGALGAHFVLLRNVDDGQRWLLVLLAVTFATDTGAYATGRLAGRHRMAPAISPAKTWEGAAGGLLAGAAAAPVAVVLLGLPPGLVAGGAIAFGLPVAGQAGDLLESAIKRRIGVKDMSALLPGHGGLLDRLDSLLLTGPALYWMLQWLAT